MKELTKEQIESIENFKKSIIEMIEKKNYWTARAFSENSSDFFNLVVFNQACTYFEGNTIPYSILYTKLLTFCYETFSKFNCKKVY